MEKGWLSVGLPILAQLRWASVGPLFHIGCGPTMYCRLLPNGQYDIGSTYAQCICFGWDVLDMNLKPEFSFKSPNSMPKILAFNLYSSSLHVNLLVSNLIFMNFLM